MPNKAISEQSHSFRSHLNFLNYRKKILSTSRNFGHKNIKNTLICIDLERAILRRTNDWLIVKVAKTLQEAFNLVEVGFDYVTETDGCKISRKRK